MRILYLAKHNPASGDCPQDYLCDMLFHGFRSLFGADVVDWPRNNSMYNDVTPEARQKMYGKGFTVFCTLDSKLPIDREDIEHKIVQHHYDLIIYGQATRSLPLFDKVIINYPKAKIVLFDGEDWSSISSDLLNTGMPIFKRELQKTYKTVYPVSFCIPTERICRIPVTKTQHTAQASTRGHTYIDEESYYNEYRKSYFGCTHKKAGWDCCRHYEIIMNRCIPQFPDLLSCPENTMTHFPKQLVNEAAGELQYNQFNNELYWAYNNMLLQHLEKNCTTQAMADYVLRRLHEDTC